MNCESGEAEHSDDLLYDVTDIERLIVDIWYNEYSWVITITDLNWLKHVTSVGSNLDAFPLFHSWLPPSIKTARSAVFKKAHCCVRRRREILKRRL